MRKTVNAAVGANIDTELKVQHGNETKEISTSDITRVGPALVSQRHCF